MKTFAVPVTFFIYMIVMLSIGVTAYRRTRNTADYFLGGRSLSPLTSGLSAGASDMSGWLLLGLPGYAYVAGYEAFWLAGGLLLGKWVNWRITARRLRTYSVMTEALTLPEYLSRRFQDHSRLIGIVSAFFILLFFLFYTSSGLVAGGKLFETVFGLDGSTAAVIATLCILSYTLFGGFLAVCWTDVVQGLLMSAALVVVPIVAIQGRFGALPSDLAAINPQLISLWHDVTGQPLSAIAIISLLAWGLGYAGQPHILVRFKGCRSNKALVTARRIDVTWTMISMVGAVLVGLAGLVYGHNQGGITLEDPEKIFLVLVHILFHPVVAGILLAAILAAVMSTIDSQLLICSSAFAEDFYKWIMKKNANPEQVLKVGRLAVAGISVCALFLAMSSQSSVLSLVSYAWGGFGAALGPVIVASLYFRRMNRNGVLAGMIVGGLTVVVWKQLSGGLFDVYEILPGIIFSTLALVVVSLLTGGPEEQVTSQHARFEETLSELE